MGSLKFSVTISDTFTLFFLDDDDGFRHHIAHQNTVKCQSIYNFFQWLPKYQTMVLDFNCIIFKGFQYFRDPFQFVYSLFNDLQTMWLLSPPEGLNLTQNHPLRCGWERSRVGVNDPSSTQFQVSALCCVPLWWKRYKENKYPPGLKKCISNGMRIDRIVTWIERRKQFRTMTRTICKAMVFCYHY